MNTPRIPDDLAALVGDRERTAGLGPPMAMVPPGWPSKTARSIPRFTGVGLPKFEAPEASTYDQDLGDGRTVRWTRTGGVWAVLAPYTSSRQQEREAADTPAPGTIGAHVASTQEERRHRELIAQLEHIVDHQQKTIEALTAAVQLLRSIDRRMGT